MNTKVYLVKEEMEHAVLYNDTNMMVDDFADKIIDTFEDVYLMEELYTYNNELLISKERDFNGVIDTDAVTDDILNMFEDYNIMPVSWIELEFTGRICPDEDACGYSIISFPGVREKARAHINKKVCAMIESGKYVINDR